MKRYSISFTPQPSSKSSECRISLLSLPLCTQQTPIYSYHSHHRMGDALKRLGLVENVRDEVLEFLAKGFEYHILSMSIPDHTAVQFGRLVD